ncbi:hypothetical protein BP6252_09474 [Coleophoma cylindrospora]|uniref:Uncharacterized protein n=1 Tax=Coleophoma cylindrospora TaxID=1849047 RepID=A0A3D8R2A0_9HELO|nr:hypothetical protein BP6252_09474 [Coleophoma cylindrospora]
MSKKHLIYGSSAFCSSSTDLTSCSTSTPSSASSSSSSSSSSSFASDQLHRAGPENHSATRTENMDSHPDTCPVRVPNSESAASSLSITSYSSSLPIHDAATGPYITTKKSHESDWHITESKYPSLVKMYGQKSRLETIAEETDEETDIFERRSRTSDSDLDLDSDSDPDSDSEYVPDPDDKYEIAAVADLPQWDPRLVEPSTAIGNSHHQERFVGRHPIHIDEARFAAIDAIFDSNPAYLENVARNFTHIVGVISQEEKERHTRMKSWDVETALLKGIGRARYEQLERDYEKREKFRNSCKLWDMDCD